MSKICTNCGEEISFRHIGGQIVPLGCRCHRTPSSKLIASEDIGVPATFATSCPICGDSVYFVRHNGGCVWFDDLGDPWPKHSCFYDDGEVSVSELFPTVRITGIGTVHKSSSRDWMARPVLHLNCTCFVGDLIILQSTGDLPSDGDIVSVSFQDGVRRLHTSHGAIHDIATELRRCSRCEDYYLFNEYKRHLDTCLKREFTSCPDCGKSFHWTEYAAHKTLHRTP